jgi:mono/diheme cytochrome c family protein
MSNNSSLEGRLTLDMRRFVHEAFIVVVLSCMGLATGLAAGQTSQSQARKPASSSAVKNPVPASPQSVAAGKALFQKYCRFCHGDDAKGNGPQAPEGTHPPNLTDNMWDHGSTDAEIFTNIKDGIGPKFDMKGYNSKLTPQDMWNLVNYIRSIGPQASTR